MNDPAETIPCKVLQLGSPTGLYGAERWILALCRHMDVAIDMTVAVIRDDPRLEAPLLEEAQRLGCRTHSFEAPGRFNWSAVHQLRAFIVSRDVQILHTHGYKTDILGLLAVRGTACRLLSTPHGWSINAGPALLLYEALDRLALRWFDAVAPLSDGLYADLASSPGLRRRLQLIPNGVDIGEIDEITTVAPEVAEWRQQGQFVIGYVGQLIERKGLKVLLEAFAGLPVPRKKLVLVGEGPQRAALEQRAAHLNVASSVQFLGFRADRLQLLRGFDVFALPSRLEGIPRCLMEAMAARVPVVATDIRGCRELITRYRTGLLFPMDDASALRNCLLACTDSQFRSGLADRARDFVVENFSAAAMARSYWALYQRLAAPGYD